MLNHAQSIKQHTLTVPTAYDPFISSFHQQSLNCFLSLLLAQCAQRMYILKLLRSQLFSFPLLITHLLVAVYVCSACLGWFYP